MDSYFSKKIEPKPDHICSSKIINIKKLSKYTTRIYFEPIPEIIFYYEGELGNIKVGSIVTINYHEAVLCYYIQFWITSIYLEKLPTTIHNTYNRFHANKIQYDNNFTIHCLHCDNTLLLKQYKPCKGKLYQPFLSDRSKCTHCYLTGYHNIGTPCNKRIIHCSKCQHDRIYML